MPALNSRQINLHLKAVPGWAQRAHTICRTFKFEGFLNSIAFVNRVAKQAQKVNHHPDMKIRFDQVTLTLTTHDAGGITRKDFALAQRCDESFAKFSGPDPRRRRLANPAGQKTVGFHPVANARPGA